MSKNLRSAGRVELRLNAAVARHRAGDLAGAKLLYEGVLRGNPLQPDALHLLGLIAQQSGDLTQARALIERSVAVRPNFARAHYNLAIVCTLQSNDDDAVASYEAAITYAPDFAEALSNLGNLYLKADRFDDALRVYAAAIKARPDFAAVYSNLGTVLIALERFGDAILALEVARRLAPNIPEVYANLGQAYRRSGRYFDAIAMTQRALELRPDYRDAYRDLAIAAYATDAFDIALDANRRLLELEPASSEVHNDRARAYLAIGRYAEATDDCDAALAVRPDYAQAHVNRALALLIRGDFARGWDEYIWLWRVPDRRASYPYLDRATLWSGEAFLGRQLLITREQGFGDAIQMVRYLPAVKARGGRVVLEVAPALVALFADLPGVDELRVTGDDPIPIDDVDLFVPLLGLPRAFKTDLTSIPAPIAYLRAPAERIERWRRRLEGPARLRIGIVWSGNPGHVDDRHRSARLEDVAALGAIDAIAWFGLQKGRDEDRRSCAALTLDPLGAEIEDFADTAAIVTHLDLVIAVDTSIAHLAGALGKPVWTLLPFAPDWRWLLERGDSPWYPTMRLFRQPRAGDWTPVFAEVLGELRALLA